ncbi:uncharacterized protein EKO05_0002242 [Ascochyta rabiei]|uniref:Uncharacterized protein n=1 Tax=Didymella rabiei TaxID=5454 RepID=A0A163JDV9_DIDRA|nr:uncharacterized protein EKO05_0002242 [Ascochyta rabiei]KZM26300.1 hypothetical protein ST47_g2605 [Ascochyta rabiei]UPX11648.1 hypothetical protein EKO05_0002242 [Ascochyta rabiei]
MGRKAKAILPPLQQVDYDALPHSVQRKYFSSLERLQIQQQTGDDQTSEPSSGSPSHAASKAPFRRLNSRRRAHTTGSSRQDHEISQAEAAFFLSLPDKVRKQQFSREEQVILLAKCDQALLPPDHDPDPEEVARQRFHDFHFDFSTNNLDQPSKRGSPRGRRSSVSAYSPSQPSFGFSLRSKKEQDTQSSLFFLDAMDSPSSRKMRPLSFRRTMSLSGPPSCHSTCSAVAGPGSPLFIFPAEYRPRHQRAHSSAIPGRRSSYTSPTPIFDAEATHYQDPETRKKLRMYLASPQKFDEAIEFGFPSTAEQEDVVPHYQLPPVTKHSRKFSRDMHTFLRDGKLSFFEDKNSENQGLESDGDSVVELESPRTPSSTGLSFRLHARQMSSIDSNGLASSQPSPGYLQREMTLRMTLTRPDLRADEDALYGWQNQIQHQHQKSTAAATVQDDPLALEELVLSDDQTGTKGPFYVKPKPRGSLVTRLLKRASLKGRSYTT